MAAKRILLVEDNIADVKLTERALKRSEISCDVVVARDGEEALDYLFGTGKHASREADDLPDVVLLDLKMPKMDGQEVLREIRAKEKTKLLPVIILTSSSEERDMKESYRLGANSYVQKPVDYTEFAEAVKRLAEYWLILNRMPEREREA